MNFHVFKVKLAYFVDLMLSLCPALLLPSIHSQLLAGEFSEFSCFRSTCTFC